MKASTRFFRVKKTDLKADAASKDLQKVSTDLAINWNIDPAKVNQVFQQVGDEEQIVNSILSPAISEVLKAATSKKTAEQIITQRTELKTEIDNSLKNRLAPYGITIRDVSLVNFGFSPEFSKAIEAKQIAEQEAKQAEFTVKKSTQDAQAQINRALIAGRSSTVAATNFNSRNFAAASDRKMERLVSDSNGRRWNFALD